MEHVFEVAGRLRVDCRLTVGTLRLVPSQNGDARVLVTPRGEGGEDLLRRGEVALLDDGGGGRQRLVVHFPARNLLSGMFQITGRGGVDVTVHCPPGSELQARTGAAGVHAEVALDAVDVVTGSGDVTLTTVAGPLAVKVGSGHVHAARIGGAAEVDAGAGGVDVDEADAALKVRTASGAVRLGRTRGSVKVTAAAGDVTVACAERGHLAVTATTGDVEVGVPPGRRLHLDVSSTLGAIRSELDTTDDAADDATGGTTGGDADLRLRIRSTTGDVTLRRAVGPDVPAA